MKTLPSPSTVSPVKQTRPNRRHTLSAEWPGVPTAVKGPTDSTVARQTYGHTELVGRLRMIGMRMRKNHPLNAVVSGPANAPRGAKG